MSKRPKLTKSEWATKNKQFKVMDEFTTNYDGREYVVQHGTLRLFNRYYRVTERVGEGIKNYVRSLNMQLKMGVITNEQYIKMRDDMLADLETKRVGSDAEIRGFDVGRTSVFFENLIEKAGISDKLFNKENLKLMNEQQVSEIRKFKRNLKIINNDPVLQKKFYDEVSNYFKNVNQFYKLHKEQGGKLTQDQINDMVSNIKELNKQFDKVKQQKLNRYV